LGQKKIGKWHAITDNRGEKMGQRLKGPDQKLKKQVRKNSLKKVQGGGVSRDTGRKNI